VHWGGVNTVNTEPNQTPGSVCSLGTLSAWALTPLLIDGARFKVPTAVAVNPTLMDGLGW